MVRYMLIALLFVIISRLQAQTISPEIPSSATPEPTQSAYPILPLQAFTLDEMAVSGVAPAEWDMVRPGSYVDPDNSLTYLLHFARADDALDELLHSILDAFEREALPDLDAEHQQDSDDIWALYRFEYTPLVEGQVVSLLVDMGIVVSDGLARVIVMQTTPERYDILHSEVFMQSVRYFGQTRVLIDDALYESQLVTRTLSTFNIETVVPLNWDEINSGAYARGDLQQDPTTLLIQTSSDLGESEFRDLFLDRLNLSIPILTGETFTSEWLNWTIYIVDIEADGVELSWQIATASDAQYAYLVVLFSYTDEVEDLRASILLPILERTRTIFTP
ncbi:MAG: hypothetical protein ACFE0Q_13565 [Anaerolineae bacterium]